MAPNTVEMVEHAGLNSVISFLGHKCSCNFTANFIDSMTLEPFFQPRLGGGRHIVKASLGTLYHTPAVVHRCLICHVLSVLTITTEIMKISNAYFVQMLTIFLDY